jgi:hypothetical protein
MRWSVRGAVYERQDLSTTAGRPGIRPTSKDDTVLSRCQPSLVEGKKERATDLTLTRDRNETDVMTQSRMRRPR